MSKRHHVSIHRKNERRTSRVIGAEVSAVMRHFLAKSSRLNRGAANRRARQGEYSLAGGMPYYSTSRCWRRGESLVDRVKSVIERGRYRRE